MEFPITCDACGDELGVAVIDQAEEAAFSGKRFLCMECSNEPETDEEEDAKEG